MAKVDRTMHDVDILDRVFRGVRASAASETPLQNFQGQPVRDPPHFEDVPAKDSPRLGPRRRPRPRRRSRSSR